MTRQNQLFFLHVLILISTCLLMATRAPEAMPAGELSHFGHPAAQPENMPLILGMDELAEKQLPFNHIREEKESRDESKAIDRKAAGFSTIQLHSKQTKSDHSGKFWLILSFSLAIWRRNWNKRLYVQHPRKNTHLDSEPYVFFPVILINILVFGLAAFVMGFVLGFGVSAFFTILLGIFLGLLIGASLFLLAFAICVKKFKVNGKDRIFFGIFAIGPFFAILLPIICIFLLKLLLQISIGFLLGLFSWLILLAFFILAFFIGVVQFL